LSSPPRSASWHRPASRCAALGFQRYNAGLGESQALGDWRSAEDIARWLLELPHEANSGDIYARRA
jgi:hypothetical protein